MNPAAVAAFARLGELELYYETQGTGPPLVLIHGSLMTADLLNDYPARLAARRRVITVELQGHGHTRDIGRPLRYELLADDIATPLDHLGLARASAEARPSCSHRAVAPAATAWRAIAGVWPDGRNTSTRPTGSGTSASVR